VEFGEKARIRVQHWIEHNEHHKNEYEAFAGELENAGKGESARHIRRMIEHTLKATECLRNALEALP